MTNEEVLKVFNDFLKEHGAYDAYWTNAAKRNSFVLPTETIHIEKSIMNSGFLWHCTKQGYKYWRALNYRWSNYCQEFSHREQHWLPIFELGLSLYHQLNESVQLSEDLSVYKETFDNLGLSKDDLIHRLNDGEFSVVGTKESIKHFKRAYRHETPQKLAEIQADAIESLKFPSMLRKMWSSSEVINWLNKQADNIRQQAKDLSHANDIISNIMQPTPHKHSELIHAWADGAEIEGRHNYKGSKWRNLEDLPGYIQWTTSERLRIKPDCVYAIKQVYELFGDYGIKTYKHWLNGGEIEMRPLLASDDDSSWFDCPSSDSIVGGDILSWFLDDEFEFRIKSKY